MTAFEADIEKSHKLDQIWEGDLLGRRREAMEVQDFLVQRSLALSRAGRPGAFTLGIDARYGIGKTFFLRALCEQVRLYHPAAFIDAWADDTIDAPWTALLVAIEEALKPYASLISPETRIALKDRGIKLITALAKNAAKKGVSYVVGEGGWDEAADALFEREAEEKLDGYRQRREAIIALRETLRSAIDALSGDIQPPLFIFVDELGFGPINRIPMGA